MIVVGAGLPRYISRDSGECRTNIDGAQLVREIFVRLLGSLGHQYLLGIVIQTGLARVLSDFGWSEDENWGNIDYSATRNGLRRKDTTTCRE